MAYWDNCMGLEWGEVIEQTATSRKTKLNLRATPEIYIGDHSLFLKGTSTGTTGFRFVEVFVYDSSKPEISNVKQSKSKVTVYMEGAVIQQYQLQYKEKGGSWKIVNKTITDGKYTFSNLKGGKTYYFRARPVTESYWWGDTYGPWSDSYSFKVKKTTV